MKLQYKNILVPYDSSGSSIVALETAEVVARKFNANLTLILISEPHKTPSSSITTALEQAVERIKTGSSISCNYMVREGKVYKEIVKAATELDADLIIMGTHGLNGFQEFFAGSNAYKVATTAPCPVITVKEHIRKENMQHILLPIDGSKDTRQKVPVAAVIAGLLGAVVHVLVVTSHNAEERKQLTSYGAQAQEYLENNDVQTVFEVAEGNHIYRLVTDYAQKIGADLIIIMTEQESESIFMGPTAQQMIHHSPFPVMSVKPRDITVSYAQL